jgi:hypothetical protein
MYYARLRKPFLPDEDDQIMQDVVYRLRNKSQSQSRPIINYDLVRETELN